MKLFLVLALGLAVVTAVPHNPQRIIGGSIADISEYPYVTALLYTILGLYLNQSCGGSIINNRSILTAAHCLRDTRNWNWRARVGSSLASSGGVVHSIQTMIVHPAYNDFTRDSDIAVLRIHGTFATDVRPGFIAGPNYNAPDNAVVWAMGWGATEVDGFSSEELRHVQIWVVNQDICKSRYAELGRTIKDNMLCSGWLDVGGRDQCIGDSGGPLLHNNVIIGVCSWGEKCGLARYPGVNVRVSSFTSWIENNV